jgi:hypothetical protein
VGITYSVFPDMVNHLPECRYLAHRMPGKVSTWNDCLQYFPVMPARGGNVCFRKSRTFPIGRDYDRNAAKLPFYTQQIMRLSETCHKHALHPVITQHTRP